MIVTPSRIYGAPMKLGSGLHAMSILPSQGRLAKQSERPYWTHSQLTDFESSEGFSIKNWVPQYTRKDNPDASIIAGSTPSHIHVKQPTQDVVDNLNPVRTTQKPVVTEFHNFMKLPMELRSQIWQMHMSQCRLVVITGTPGRAYSKCKNEAGQYYSSTHWYTYNQTPAIMRVCREARDEALRFYRIALPLGTRNVDEVPDMCQSPNPAVKHQYINPEWDMVLYAQEYSSVPEVALLNDLAAWDPLLEGAHHFGTVESYPLWKMPFSIDKSMLNLSEATMCLKTWLVWHGRFDPMNLGFTEGFLGQMRDSSFVEDMWIVMCNGIRSNLRTKLHRFTMPGLVTITATAGQLTPSMNLDGPMNCEHGVHLSWEDGYGWTGSRLVKFADKVPQKANQKKQLDPQTQARRNLRMILGEAV